MSGLIIAFAWFLTIAACALAVLSCAVAADSVDKTWLSIRARRALPCLCCTSRPYTVDDCNCRTDCGQVHCQAAEPPDHIEGCGPDRNMLAYPSLACPGCDWIAERMEKSRG